MQRGRHTGTDPYVAGTTNDTRRPASMPRSFRRVSQRPVMLGTPLGRSLTRPRLPCAQTLTLIGEAAIHTAVKKKMVQPIASIAQRSRGAVSLVLMPAKNSDDANRTTPST